MLNIAHHRRTMRASLQLLLDTTRSTSETRQLIAHSRHLLADSRHLMARAAVISSSAARARRAAPLKPPTVPPIGPSFAQEPRSWAAWARMALRPVRSSTAFAWNITPQP